jgi:hypothetical protein
LVEEELARKLERDGFMNTLPHARKLARSRFTDPRIGSQLMAEDPEQS